MTTDNPIRSSRHRTAPHLEPAKPTHTMLRFNIFAALLVISILSVIALNNGPVDSGDAMWWLLPVAHPILAGLVIADIARNGAVGASDVMWAR